MSDGAILEGLNITVYYHASYAEFKEMVQALATDERIASIQYATFSYDSSEKKLTGQMTLTIYLMQTLEDGYEEPAVTVPDTERRIFSVDPVGKDTVWQRPESGAQRDFRWLRSWWRSRS